VHLPVAFAGRRWLELALDYRCNLRCLGCHACHDTGERLASSEAVAWLRAGRDRGIERLWLGGGEPTLRDDLLGIVRAARELGYTEVAVQTNGMRLSYAAYRDALLAAGVTEVRLNVKSHRAEVHDRLSGGEKCHGLLLEGLAGLSESRVRVAADVLLTKTTMADLPELVAFFAQRGVGAFALWLLSASDAPEPSVTGEVPRIQDLVPWLVQAEESARRSGVTLASLHTPVCTLPPPLRHLSCPASTLSLVVVGPDARPFALEASPFEGGGHVAACEGCVERSRCGGPRADYMRIHGESEFARV
jgi:MoaA/NifB/PqqE/SkfB family radical SAM enzyme